MKTATTECIILGHKNFMESDKIIFLYSKDLGKIKAIAKGARKITSKFTGHLETLNICIVSLYFGPRNAILTEILTKKSFFQSRKNLETISGALKIAEITNQMLYEDQSLENLFSLIKNATEKIISSPKKNLIYYAYIIKLMDKFGIIPDFKATEIGIEKKYIKFFNYIKISSFTEIEKILLSKKEENYIEEFTKKLIQEDSFDLSSRETLKTPLTLSSLSKTTSN